MTVDLLKNIVNIRPEGRALMGLDVGSKTIGVALSDSSQNIAMPLKTIERTKFTRDLQQIEKLVTDYEVGGFVIGLPLNMDGSEGGRCQSIRDFALELNRQIKSDVLAEDGKIWISLWDERLSTATVENFVDEVVDIKRRRAKERGILDKLAAQHILQGALDYIQRNLP